MSEVCPRIVLPHLRKKGTTMSKIASLKITIDNTPYYYEAHSMHRVAEILKSQLQTLHALSGSEVDEFGLPIYKVFIQDFEVLYFNEVE